MQSGGIDSVPYVLKTVPIESITVWTEAQARKLDTENIDDLARSIQSEGLQHPLTVLREGPRTYKLLAGQRRLEALKSIGYARAPVLVLDGQRFSEISDAKAVSVIENIHRKGMSAKEVAASCKFLAEKMGRAKAAKALGINPDTLREYLGFDGIPDEVKEMVPKSVSRRDAVRICRVISQPQKAAEFVKKASKYPSAKRTRYIEALEKAGDDATPAEIARIANSFRARRNVAVHISKSQAKGLAKLSRESEMEPAEFAQKIVSDYLARRGIK